MVHCCTDRALPLTAVLVNSTSDPDMRLALPCGANGWLLQTIAEGTVSMTLWGNSSGSMACSYCQGVGQKEWISGLQMHNCICYILGFML